MIRNAGINWLLVGYFKDSTYMTPYIVEERSKSSMFRTILDLAESPPFKSIWVWSTPSILIKSLSDVRSRI